MSPKLSGADREISLFSDRSLGCDSYRQTDRQDYVLRKAYTRTKNEALVEQNDHDDVPADPTEQEQQLPILPCL